MARRAAAGRRARQSSSSTATDRLVVDASALVRRRAGRLRQLASLYDRFDRLSIRDFALVRQSRWREAIASVFDMPEYLPYLGPSGGCRWATRRTTRPGRPGSTNLVKPLYHVAWLGSRLGMRVTAPLVSAEPKGRRRRRGRGGASGPPMHRGLAGG